MYILLLELPYQMSGGSGASNDCSNLLIQSCRIRIIDYTDLQACVRFEWRSHIQVSNLHGRCAAIVCDTRIQEMLPY